MDYRAALLALSFSIFSTSIAASHDFAKAKLLPAKEDARWVTAAKSHITKDGATALQVLQYAEKLRPSQFKFEFNGVGYNGKTGEADAVSISYWIGAKRLPDDYYVNLFYSVSVVGGKIKVSVPENPYSNETPTGALEGGRDSFLRFVDRAYEEDCIDASTGAKLC